MQHNRELRVGQSVGSPNRQRSRHGDHDDHISEEKSSITGDDDETSSSSRGTRQIWEQRTWKTKENIHDLSLTTCRFFLLKVHSESRGYHTIIKPIPATFHDLVQMFHEHKKVPPFWTVPNIMGFSELKGYPWRHRGLAGKYLSGDELQRYLDFDNVIIESIVRASHRIGRVPLHAPDYFFLGCGDTGARHVRDLFNNRISISNIQWNPPEERDATIWLSAQIEDLKKHVDWQPFHDYLLDNVPTSEYLFPVEIWSKARFARAVTERSCDIPARKEIVDYVQTAGYQVEIQQKTGWFGKQLEFWSAADILIIRRVAHEYWLKWRNEAERQLENTAPSPSLIAL
ncbi:hypothetical protein BT63DRAFT_452967 [Microthyrium microscopicum]|uniref:Uncharacterized protein n=1 Tax=Microthyrium microscopicum TaxID=703497 RepID=A0A6A6ULS4_9PEZI|nr:hypothetical protein BT63DRAFT_452967 [Microthyrium microscopicum]